MGCTYVILLFVFIAKVSYLVLDPRISYEGMKSDYADDDILTDYLETAKVSLHRYFHDNYAGKNAAPSVTAASIPHHDSTSIGASQP